MRGALKGGAQDRLRRGAQRRNYLALVQTGRHDNTTLSEGRIREGVLASGGTT